MIKDAGISINELANEKLQIGCDKISTQNLPHTNYFFKFHTNYRNLSKQIHVGNFSKLEK